MRISIEYEDGRTVEVRPTPYNIVAFEREFKMSLGQLEKEQRAEHVMWLAWHRLHQIGQEPADFETFLQKLGELDGVTSDANPPLPPPDSSPA